MDEILKTNVPYVPISKKGDSDGWVGSELFYAQQEARAKIDIALINDWDNYVAGLLGIDKESLWDNFSAEQIDAIGIAIEQIKKNNTFILADETGKGKGRVLAGIAKWATLNKLNTVFFTEKHTLFTDFWRDLTFTKNNDIKYKVLHPDARIYSIEGEEIYKSSLKNIKEILSNKDIHETLILTTYSQVSNSQQKKRITWFERVLEQGILILDESHNASGESNTNKFISKLIKKAKGTIFSSATFMKEENEIDLYQKAYQMDKGEWALLHNLLVDAPNGLRRFLTYDLTKKLSLWRREHEPPMHEWETIISDIKLSSEFSGALQDLAKMHEEILLKNQETLSNVWYEWGSEIQRLAKNFILLSKIDTLISEIEKKRSNNEKSVVIIDSTFASLIHKIGLWLNQEQGGGETKATEKNTDAEEGAKEEDMEAAEESDIKNKEEDETGKEEINKKNNNDHNNKAIDEDEETEDDEIINLQNDWTFALALRWVGEKLVGQYEKSERWYEWLEKIKIFEELKLSPIDTIKEKLEERGIFSSEISGRNFYINKDGKITKQKINRITETRKFNDGVTDVAILTRAGAAGISLHSDKNFKDTRRRNLYELEIVNRPTSRIQFIGRVRRKNQVNEPRFYKISSTMAFEQRINDFEALKLQRAKAYIRASQEEEITLYNNHSNSLAESWLKKNKSLAWRLGIYLNVTNKPLYYIDSILKRSILLNSLEQESMLNFIINGTLDYQEEIKIDYKINHVEHFWSHMTEESKLKMQQEYKLNPDKRAFLGSFDYGWCALSEVVGTGQLKEIKKEYLQDILKRQDNNKWQKSKNFLLNYYKKRQDFGYRISENSKNNLAIIDKINPGVLIKLIWNNSVYFGYCEEHKVSAGLENSLVHNWLGIRLINPKKIKTAHHIDEKIYISYHQLIEEASVQLYLDKTITWEQFERNHENVDITNYYWMGHPLYIYYLKQCYKIGEDSIFYDDKINNKILSAIKLPDYFNFQYAKTCKKPIPPTETMNYILERNPDEINNSINASIEPTIRLVQTTGGYQLMIKPEVSKNKKMFDYAIKKRMGLYKYINGYEAYFINYKDIRIILLMMEKRGLGWFI